MMDEAANRIEWLEQRLRETTGELVQANDRIEALEAALRPFAEFGDPRNLNHELTRADCYAAYIALAEGQDK